MPVKYGWPRSYTRAARIRSRSSRIRPHCLHHRRYCKVMPFASIPEAIDEIRAGRMVIVVDDEDRENEGDLTAAAEKITPEMVNFMAKFGRGMICLALTGERCEELQLPPIAQRNTSRFGTAF